MQGIILLFKKLLKLSSSLKDCLKVFDSALVVNPQQLAELDPEFEKKLFESWNHFS